MRKGRGHYSSVWYKMSNINILRDADEPFYRYQRAKFVLKSEGRGNGFKTVVENIEDVARALGRSSSRSSFALQVTRRR